MKQKLNNPKQGKRIKKFAATVVALGTAIGVNMGEVLAGSSEVGNIGARKGAAVSSKLKNPGVKADKSSRTQLKKRPSTLAHKDWRPGMKTRPNVRADKADRTAPKLQTRPGSTSLKLGKDGRELK